MNISGNNKLRKSVKKSTKKTSDKEKTKQIVKDILKNISDEKRKQLEDSDYIALYNMITEYLDDFIILGHNIDGERVVLSHTPTPAKLDGLIEMCKKTLSNFITQEYRNRD